MKPGRIFLIAAPLVLLLAVLAACDGDGGKGTDTPVAGGYDFTLRQSDGVTLALEQPPQRIVSLSAHFTEILCTIGAGEQLVAVDPYANCPAGGEEKPVLDSFQPNLEAIAGYQPDLVYVFSNMDNIVEALREIDIPVLYLELPSSVEGVLDQILLFGRLTGHEAEAQDLIRSMRERMDALRERLADVEEGPRVFHEVDSTYFTVSPDSFVGDLYEFLKAQNIAAGADTPYPQLSAETIIQRDPEVIVLADEAAGVTPESVRERPGWGQISAVRNDRICVIDPALASQPGPRIVDALEELAQCLYPDRFP